MSNHGDMSVTQMMWKPRLLKLTQIGFEAVDGGEPTVLFLDPSSIMQIYRSQSQFNKLDGTKTDPVICTTIHCCHFTCAVIETPEQIAMLRDRALGHEPEKPKAA